MAWVIIILLLLLMSKYPILFGVLLGYWIVGFGKKIRPKHSTVKVNPYYYRESPRGVDSGIHPDFFMKEEKDLMVGCLSVII